MSVRNKNRGVLLRGMQEGEKGGVTKAVQVTRMEEAAQVR